MNRKNMLENISLEEYTTPTPYYVLEGDSIVDVLKVMDKRGIRHVPVLNSKGDAVGILSDRDVAAVKTFAFKADIPVKDLMTLDPVSVNFRVSLLEAAYKMAKYKIGSLIVNDDQGEIYGIFTSTDALNALVEVLRGDIHGERDFVQDY